MNDSTSFAVAYRAKWVFTGRGEPLRNGFVVVRDGRFGAVGQGDPGMPAIDLRDAAILPTFVNAHTHLEFSDLPAPLPAGPNFAGWIRAVVEARRAAFANPKAESLARAAVARGLSESLFAGTALLGEIASDSYSPAPFAASPIAAVVFSEVLGVSPERGARSLLLAGDRLDATDDAESLAFDRPDGTLRTRLVPGISPHAPYTVPTALLDEAIGLARRYRAPVAMHLAESPDEIELLATGTGPLRETLEALGAFDAQRLALYRKPADYIERLARCDRALIVHGNYLDADDVAAIARDREKLSVVYCPRTHAHFGFDRHPLLALRAAGIRVVVGTDSRASNPDLSMLSELRTVAQKFPEIPGADVLAMGTHAGAEALGRGDSFGLIEENRPANLVVASIDSSANDPYEALWNSSGNVLSTMIQGAWSAGEISLS